MILLAILIEVWLRASLVAIYSWGALEATGEVGAPAWVFMLNALVSVLGGPVLGVLGDRIEPRRALISGALGTVASIACFIALSGEHVGLPLFMAASFLTASCGLVTLPALHRLLQAHTGPENALRAASRASTCVALGGVTGAAASGLLLGYGGLRLALVACAIAAGTVATIGAFIRSINARSKQSTKQHLIVELREGVSYLLHVPVLRVAAFASVLTFAVSSVSAALLPAFVREELQLGAVDFGTLRTAWPVGAILGGLVTSWWGGKRKPDIRQLFAWLALLGVATTVFAISRDLVSAVLWVFVSGFAFATCRAILDGSIMSACDPQWMGRTRSNLTSLNGVSSLVIYFVSSQTHAGQIRSVFTVAGVILVLGSIVGVLQQRFAPALSAQEHGAGESES